MKLLSLSIVMLSANLVGCASIVNGQNQVVSVETRTDAGPVSGASCKLSNNKGSWFLTSPGTTTVNRSFEDLSVRCEKEPHEPGLVSAKSSTKAMAFGNILFGGPIGAGVDIATGAAYDYPAVITVFMAKTMVVPAASTGAAPAAAPANPAGTTAAPKQ